MGEGKRLKGGLGDWETRRKGRPGDWGMRRKD
jgi:hypothetical protein